MVHCNGYTVITGNGGTAPVGSLFLMDSLPFTTGADAAKPYETGSCMVNNLNLPDNAMSLVTYKPASNNNMYIYHSRDNSSWGSLNCDDTVFDIIWSLSYKVG